MRKLQVLFLGMRGSFSRLVLESLLADVHSVVGIVLPVTELDKTAVGGHKTAVANQPGLQRLPPEPSLSMLPMLTPFAEKNIIHLGWEQDIPVFAMSRPMMALAALQTLRPDVACVACYPDRLPTALLTLPPHGFLNVHPSLLPAYRGPEPIFWQWQRGEPNMGVTVHQMDVGLDTGPIVGETAVSLPDGLSRPEADQHLAIAGGHLLGDCLTQLAAGTLTVTPQTEGGSTFPWPSSDDFRLEPTWTAQHAFNFMRGTADWQRPYRLDITGQTWWLRTAVGYSADDTQTAPVRQTEAGLWVQFARGVLQAR